MAMPSELSMEAKLVCTCRQDEALFLECGPDVINVLVALIQSDLGSVGQAAQDGQKYPGILSFMPAILKMRDVLFSGKKAAVLPEKLDVEEVMASLVTKPCLYCLKFSGSRCDVLAGQDCCECDVPFDTRPHDGTCPECDHPLDDDHCCGECGMMFIKDVQGTYCLKCADAGLGAHEMEGRVLDACSKCGASGAERTLCSSCQWCAHCSLEHFKLCYHLASDPPARSSVFKPTANFMMTDSLEVFEASPAKMLELVARSGPVSPRLEGFKTVQLKASAKQLKQLALLALLGSSQVLTKTFLQGGKKTTQLEDGASSTQVFATASNLMPEPTSVVMEATIVRARTGEVFFLESGADLIGYFVARLHEPVAALVQSMSLKGGDSTHPGFISFVTTVLKLRPVLFEVDKDEVAPSEIDVADSSDVFKEIARFMITDSLEVFEASPAKMLELISRAGPRLEGHKICEVKVTEGHLKQILLLSLLGSNKIFTETFPLAGSEYEVWSDTGSDGSFVPVDADAVPVQPRGEK